MGDEKTLDGLTDAQKLAVKNASGSKTKKALWWVVGGLGVALIIAFAIIMILAKKKPGDAVNKVIQKSKKEIDKLEVEAKVKAAENAAVEKAKVEEIRKIGEIDDVDERRKRLAELL